MAIWIVGLACLCGDPWVEFSKLSRDRDPDIRIRAIEAIPKDAGRQAVQALLPLLGDEHPRVRYRTMRALARLRGERQAVENAIKCPSSLVRRGICEVLGEMRDAASAPVLEDRLDDPDPSVRAEAARALGTIGGAEEALIRAFDAHRDGVTRAAIVEAARSPALFNAALDDRDYRVRLVAAELCPDTLSRLIGDEDWRVRLAALDSCRKLRPAAAPGWLIDRYPREEGRLQGEMFAALRDIAGRDLGPNPKAWQSWWAASGSTFNPSTSGGGGAAPSGETRATFFDIPVTSTRIIFILDLSGSMRDAAPKGPGTKLDAAKEGMLQTIRALPPETRFGIIGLGSEEDGRYAMREQKTWRRSLSLWPATPELKADAQSFVRRLEARGWTNLYDAIEYAFMNPDVDSIYLYTDGGASTGIFRASAEILLHVETMNRFRKIAIHTVEVPGTRNPADNRRLLQALAERTGGLYRLAGGPPIAR